MISSTQDPIWLRETTAAVFEAAGVAPDDARFVADSLVAADEAGVPSHGVMLVPMYVDRLRRGSVAATDVTAVVADDGATAVLDAGHSLGQLSARRAMDLAIEKAERFGIGVVTVRHAFHFGRASQYADRAAARGMIGIAASNTRPMMPAPGGAEPVVGNNPFAVAVPGDDERSFTLDMALSEVALGKIRMAASSGSAIPEHWATDRDGNPTTDAHAAIDGMLLPAGGPKGFGLALVVEILTGVLSGGAVSHEVRGLYADTAAPNDSAQFFLAIDVNRFLPAASFTDGLSRLVDPILAAGVHTDAPPRLPGHGARAAARRANGAGVAVSARVLDDLIATATTVGATVPAPPSGGRA
ncbi:Ldh family oxidoreductase [Agromyces badenianii]|uniref:Ldh family oxidoreductase n=1 Tax=Agromyces badenianii TaxID=2080742 RepID=UPI000D5A0433|nr:Ldh family oxidoreductase [Agromyces badenianii]PWC03393.1 lactate dehydrogenase [Agromyces badenianii]